MDYGSNRVLQVTNIAPQATRDQMNTLFSNIGRVEEIRLYPTVRDAAVYVQVRCCFLRFADPSCVSVAQHLNNTVFIDRAIILTPLSTGEVPDEATGLQLAQDVGQKKDPGVGGQAVRMPPNVVNRLEDDRIITFDPRLSAMPHLPQYPPLPGNTQHAEVEAIRRTITLFGLDSNVSAQQCMEVFSHAGEVKFFRFCTRENDIEKYALIEFTEHAAVISALEMNDQPIGHTTIKVNHSLMAISKPTNKSNEAAQREIEEAMSKVKEAQSLVSAAVDPLMGMLSGNGRGSHTRSRSRSRSRRPRSRSRGRSHYNARRSRSRDRRRSRSRRRSRERKRARSKDRKRKTRSRSRDRKKKKSRSRSRDPQESKDKDKPAQESKDKDKPAEDTPENGTKAVEGKKDENGKENGEKRETKSRARSKSRDKKRSRSRDRKRSRSKDRKKSRGSRSKDRRHRSRSKDRKRSRSRRRSKSKERKRSRSKDKKRSKDHKDKKRRSPSRERKREEPTEVVKVVKDQVVKRDYDQEEAGFESQEAAAKGKVAVVPLSPVQESIETQDMEISNSP
eukprot:maker-scaffold1207_size55689-snap-gene-0.15 protein:Tk07833 transcript:maker-scaffold1207_size55689-snap-gene-0.15-mRNA-1 annotation:"probable splicing arginine serine-rich 7"